MANPRIPQGNLNRVRGSIVWATVPNLNVIASFLGQGGISFRTEGTATTRLNTMTGVSNSPEIQQPAILTVALLKTQALCVLYENRRLTNSILGDCTVRTDAQGGGLETFQLENMSIDNVNEMSFNGSQVEYVVTLGGVYVINADLWGGP
jgi:hypothetical protein